MERLEQDGLGPFPLVVHLLITSNVSLATIRRVEKKKRKTRCEREIYINRAWSLERVSYSFCSKLYFT